MGCDSQGSSPFYLWGDILITRKPEMEKLFDSPSARDMTVIEPENHRDPAPANVFVVR